MTSLTKKDIFPTYKSYFFRHVTGNTHIFFVGLSMLSILSDQSTGDFYPNKDYCSYLPYIERFDVQLYKYMYSSSTAKVELFNSPEPKAIVIARCP